MYFVYKTLSKKMYNIGLFDHSSILVNITQIINNFDYKIAMQISDDKHKTMTLYYKLF